MKKLVLLLTVIFVSACSKVPQTVVFNEVSWMGTEESALNEWIELRNTTGEDIDLNGWRIRNLD